jgi:type II secretory pathway pseudopilin PulG
LEDRVIGRSGNRAIRNRRQEGYVLLTLLLMVALVVIALAAVLPSITTQIRRDREQELIHRGAQYARAIKKYYKKFGNYPVTLDQLNGVNNIRFLRKRYKDPITGQDFRLLRYGDVQLSFGSGGLQPVVSGGTQSGSAPSSSQSSSSSSSPFISVSQMASPSTPAPSGSQPGATPASSTNQVTAGAAQQTVSSGSATQGTSPSSSPTTSQGSSQSSSQGAGQSSSSPASSSQAGTQGPTFGGGPVIGVASTSNKRSFHVFNNKDHYKDWAFVYDVSSDRGALITGPYNGPPKFGTGQISGATSLNPTQTGTSGSSSTQSSSPFSQSPSTSTSSQSSSTQQGSK